MCDYTYCTRSLLSSRGNYWVYLKLSQCDLFISNKPNSNPNLIPAFWAFDHEAYTQDCCASCLILRISQRCHTWREECHITAWRLSGFAKPKTNRRNWKCQPRHTLGSAHNRRNAAVNPAAAAAADATVKIIIIFSKVSTREQTFRYFVRTGEKWEALCGPNKLRQDLAAKKSLRVSCVYYWTLTLLEAGERFKATGNE